MRGHYDVVVVGDAAQDTIVCAPNTTLDDDSSSVILDRYGGQGFNMARASQRAGAHTLWVTGLDGGEASNHIRAQALSEGIDVYAPVIWDRLPRVVSLVNARGQRTLYSDRKASLYPPPPMQVHSPVVLLSAYGFAARPGRARLDEWIRWAHEQSAQVLLDPGNIALARALLPVSDCVDWFLPNHAEWQQWVTAYSHNVLIKQGPQGITLVVGDVATQIPTDLVPVVDSTGAGDCLAGTFAANLALKMVPVTAARNAQLVTQRLIAEQGRQLWSDEGMSSQPSGEILRMRSEQRRKIDASDH